MFSVMKTMLIIDGNSIVNRAFFGVRPLTTHDGLPTGAVFGVLSILLRQLESLQPDYAAVAYDLPSPTFRHLAYEGYKSNRHGMPDDLARQFPYAKDCIAALGIAPFEKEGFEADDIIGTLATEAAKSGIHAYILTGDRDSLQLIGEQTTVLLATNNDTVTYDRTAFLEKYGVQPEQFVDVKALMGDSSDCIPGVPGIGEKTALKLISTCGSLDGVYHDVEGLTGIGPAAKTKLANGRESAYLSQMLSRIRTDVPLDKSPQDCAYTGFHRQELYELLTRLEFTSFIRRLQLTADAAENSVSAEKDEVSFRCLTGEELHALPEGCYGMQMSDAEMFVSDGREVWKASFDPSFFAGHTVAVSDAKGCYRALRHAGMTHENAVDAIAFDVTLAAYLLSPIDASYPLSKLSAAYLGTLCEDSPAAQAKATRQLREPMTALLREQGQWGLYEKVELPLSFVLAEMEEVGFRIDTDGLQKYGEALDMVAQKTSEGIYEAAGRSFNINSPKQLGEILFDVMQLPAPKKTKTGYSTSAEVLEKLRPYYPIVDQILDYRQVTKLKSTYVDGLLRVADGEGRVHTNFHQTVTATGRLSSTDPNLQNIPIRTELGRELRRFFTARDGYVLVDADYSQIELRLLAHIAGDANMIEAFLSGEDFHTVTASQVFGVPIDAVTSELRKRAKAVNFGVVYGISDFSLAQDLGVSRKEAAQYIESYFAKYANVRDYMETIVACARENGYVSTLYGRRRPIPELSSPKKPLQAFGERVARNSPIQGTAADLIKIAMIRTADALRKSGLDAHLILQVHDELIVEAREDCADAASALLRRAMEEADHLSVPLSVDINVGKNWYFD